MRLIFTLILFLVTISCRTQDTVPPKIDAVTSLIQEYYNKKNAAALYRLGGEAFHQQISEEQFSKTVESLHQQVGKFKEVEFESLNGKVAKFKVSFTSSAVLALYVSLDDADKLETFLLQPYVAPLTAKENSAAVLTDNPLRTALDKLVDSLVTPFIKRDNTVGLAIGLLQNGRASIYGYGETKKGSGQIPDSKTLFEIGSVTKTFTATLLAYYVQQGKLKLEDPINKYLPDSIPALAYNGKAVTIASLSNHSSGLPRLPADLFFSADINNPYKQYDNKKLFSFLSKYKMTREPGAQYEYSNLAVGLLGVILERIGGKTYEQLVKEIIWQPLGMNDTRVTIGKADSAKFAQGYNANAQPAHSWEFISLLAAGGIRSNVNDMLLYAKAQVTENTTTTLQKAIALTHKSTYKKDGNEVALGWHFVNAPGNKRYMGHNGQTGGYCSIVIFDLQTRRAVVILTNASVQPSSIALTLLNRLNQ